MLSPRRTVDGPSPCQAHPGQGCYQIQGSNCTSRLNARMQIQTNFDHTPQIASPPTTPTTTSPPPVPRKDYYTSFSADRGSPIKQRSPLRHSVSYSDPPELAFPGATSWGSADTPNFEAASPIMSYTGDKKIPAPLEGSPRNRTGWFSRGSTPEASSTEATPTRGNGRSRSETTSPQTSPATASRFAFLTSSMSAFKGLTSPVAAPRDEELINLDINAALFPSGPPSDRDTFSPAAFKNLQMTATGLLLKFQTAYQQRTVELRELKSDQETQSDSKMEAETRAQHLKLQLEGMAQKAAEQEAVMQALMEELNREKRLRIEERSAREKSMISEGSTVSEDLGVEEDRRMKWRKSGETAKSDLSFDTDEDSVEEASVFSRSRSPTIAASVSEASTIDAPTPPPKPAMQLSPRIQKQTQQPLNTFQKLFKGISNESTKIEDPQGGVSGCRNCQGQEASVAWDTVSLLRDENRGLKERVGDLESAVEGALDAVNGITL